MASSRGIEQVSVLQYYPPVMLLSRAWALVTGAVLSSSTLLICCGTDEAIGPNDTPKGDLVGGEPNFSEAGQSSGGAPGSVAGNGGNAGNSGTLNIPIGGDGQQLPGGGADGLGGGGVGGATPVGGDEMLELCARLNMKVERARAVAIAFNKAAYGDCDMYWTQRLAVDAGERDDFLNALATWSYNLWGCGVVPVSNFPLIYGEPPISAGDAQRLIEIYVRAVDDNVELSPGEDTELRAALGRLSLTLVDDPSLEPSKPGSNWNVCQKER